MEKYVRDLEDHHQIVLIELEPLTCTVEEYVGPESRHYGDLMQTRGKIIKNSQCKNNAQRKIRQFGLNGQKDVV